MGGVRGGGGERGDGCILGFEVLPEREVSNLKGTTNGRKMNMNIYHHNELN